MSPLAFPLLRAAALVGAVALLLADSAEPYCVAASFDTTYSVETDCATGGSEVVRIRNAPPVNSFNASVEHLEGDTLSIRAKLLGTCEESGDTLQVESMLFQFAGHTTGSDAKASYINCRFALGGGEAECRADGADAGCTLTASVVP